MNKNKEKVAKYFTNFVIEPGISNNKFPLVETTFVATFFLVTVR